MTGASEGLEEQFEDRSQQREAATLGMWAFLATEVLFFGAMFLSYCVYRQAYPEAFARASRHTLVFYGTVNTAILLTSSLTMALAVHAARADEVRWLIRYLVFTMILGMVFLAIKGLEYRADLREDLWPGPNFKEGLPAESQIFWFLYWVMTGVHALHVSVGVCVLAVMAWMASRLRFSGRYFNPVEMSGLYWHFVDVIWIFLYPLLYLVHRYSAP